MDEGRGIYSVAMFHVGASSISLAPTYFISQSALMPLLLLSKSNPLRWASIWVFSFFCRIDSVSPPALCRSNLLYRLLRLIL